jgi:hypothetical protein
MVKCERVEVSHQAVGVLVDGDWFFWSFARLMKGDTTARAFECSRETASRTPVSVSTK